MVKITQIKSPVAYVLWKFPVLSETFISNEIRTLAQSFDIKIYSIKKVDTANIHEEVKPFLQKISYNPSIFSLASVRSIFLFLLNHPLRVLKVIFIMLSTISWKYPFIIPYFLMQGGYCFLKACHIADQIEKNRLIHLHSHFAESSALTTMIVSILTDIPYSFTMHAYDIFVNKNKPLIIQLIKNSQFSVTISEYNKKYLESFDDSIGEKIKVVHCGVDLSQFKPVKNRVGETFQFLTVARLVKKKGVEQVILALSKLLSENYSPRIVYKIIGTGPEEKNLEKLIKKQKLENSIELLGAKSSQEIRNELMNSHAFILYSLPGSNGDMDGIPVALMEAMAMELPVITTRLSGIPELVKDGSGFVSAPGDENALVANLRKVILLPENERKKMGRIGRNIIEKDFNLEIETRKLKYLFLKNHV